MAQQFTDRAYESCHVVGLGVVTFLGPKFSFVSVPVGDSICLIEALDVNGNPNGQWEVNSGVRTANTFTRGTVVASSNANNPVTFSGTTSEITLVVSSSFYEAISAAVAQNTADTTANGLAIAQNASDITDNAGNISSNAAAINSNSLAIAQNANDIAGKENSLGNPTADGQALISTIAGIRSWANLVKAFVDLSDSPASYVGQQGKLVKVNATADGLIFGDPSGTTVSWGDIQGLLSDQTDLQNALDAKLDANATAINSDLLEGQDGAFYLDGANQTGLLDPTKISFPNVSATDMVDLQHFYDHAWSAGLTDILTPIVDGGGCTVNIPEMEVTFRIGVDEHDQLIALVVPAQLGFVVGVGAGNLYVDYNGGVPIYGFRMAGLAKLNLRTELPLAAVACDGTNVTILSISQYNTDSTGLLVRRLIDLGIAHAPGGTVLGDAGTLHINITAGLFYLALQPIPNTAVDTSGIDTFIYWYQDGVGGWNSQINQSQISNQLYDDGSGTLATIGNGDYSQSWIYMTASDAGFQVHALYGDLSVNTESEVLTTSPPSSIPPALQFLGVLVGRVIVNENNVTSFTTVESAFIENYSLGGVTSHNALPGLQGGDINDYYHVTAAQILFFQTYPSTDRMQWKNVWVPGTYQKNDVVYDNGWAMVANKTTDEQAAPHTDGSEFSLYNGTLSNVTASGSQIIQGVQITPDRDSAFNGFKAYTYLGATYSAFIVIDPLGANRVEFIGEFPAYAEGWRTFNLPPFLLDAGVTVQILVAARIEDIAPVTFSGFWDYLRSTNSPAIGQITQGSSGVASLNVSYTDADGGNRATEIQSLTVGDKIIGAGRTWIIQEVVNFFTAYGEFKVSPAVQGTAETHATFLFEKVADAIIPYSEDTDYWFNNPDDFATQGLYGLDIPYTQINPNNTAYGVDVLVQYITNPVDWDVLSSSTGGTGGSGSGTDDHTLLNNRELADQHPQAAITGLVADLAAKEPGLGNPTVDGYVLSSLINGTRSWIAQSGGGVNPTQLATAWCTFDGTVVGTNAPIDGFNVVSVTRNSVGNYTITFITPMDITAFNVTGGIDSTTVGANSFLSVLNYRNKLVTSVDIYTGYFTTSNAFSDYGEVSIQIFGGKN